MKTPAFKSYYKGFYLGAHYLTKEALPTDSSEIIPAGTRVEIVHITPSVRREGVYFFNCDTMDGKRIRPSANELHATKL